MAAHSTQNESTPPGSEPAAAALQHETGRLRTSGVLGEARLRKLFDYLAERAFADQSPKEIAIAMDVFGKDATFDVSQDAVVRVYIHKLRKVLEEFYASSTDCGASLSIPRGEYRLKVSAPSMTRARGTVPPTMRRTFWVAAGLVGVALLIGLAWGWRRIHETDVERVQANPIWSGILADERPIVVVLGDYYLVGETDDSVDVKRLIREFSVNSKSDLDRFLLDHPELASRYMDVGLRYLPVSTAFALRDVMTVLAPQAPRVTISKMSDLEPSTLKSADIVYIGFLSGMGMLQDFAFTGSGLAIGESYDEIIDIKTNHTYVSEVGDQVMHPKATGKELAYRDYGVFQKLQGPGGNTILVIAGTRDEGVSQTAEAFTNAQKLKELEQQADIRQPLEALLEVRAFNGTNMTGKIVWHAGRGRIK